MNVPDHIIHLISRSMASSPVRNYVVPGLTSSLVAGEGHGKVRVFDSERAHREFIVPHSHRFDFACLVLEGTVENIVYTESPAGEDFCVGTIYPDGDFGKYRFQPGVKRTRYIAESRKYAAGDWYSMSSFEVHSIYFGADTKVLFFEGPPCTENSLVLEPWSQGERVPTFETRPWMFRKGRRD